MTPVSYRHITNPLATSAQLIEHQNHSTSDTQSIHFAQSLLTQSAGILLRLPQEVIATALIFLQRYQLSRPSANQRSARTISSAAIYLAAKLSFTPVSPRSVINIYAYLKSHVPNPPWISRPASDDATTEPDPSRWNVTEGTYLRSKQPLFDAEKEILTALRFDTHVSLPHALALTYISALGVASSTQLATRVFEHLNGALLSPQMLYLTHQPNALAVAAIYLASRQVGVKLVEENWWEVFDVDREDLGFLVLGMGSLAGFGIAEKAKWDTGGVLLSD